MYARYLKRFKAHLSALLLSLVTLLTPSIVYAAEGHNHDHSSPSDTATPEQRTATAFSKREFAVTQLSRDGMYRVSLFSDQAPIPLKKIHTWTVHLETIAGDVVEGAKLYVFGGMPIHKHGFPTKPKIEQYLGNGDYTVEGIKFDMPGSWEMRFNIQDKEKQDRAVFHIELR